jgi:outer-membrane receptor for ferric coprogen and ferric-rhodotorulic acid
LGSTTEGSNSYTTGETSTATKLPLSLRETPQSVTVITRQQMTDQGLGQHCSSDVANAGHYRDAR